MTVFALNGVVPKVGRGVFVAPSASVIGDVVLGDESSVWFGTVLRGDVFPIRIGARTNVQDNAVVHVTGGQAATSVGDDVTIGHMALIHGCTVGNRCLIGMGSVLLDGAVIEDDCLVAAGSLVPPRMRIPSRSLVMGRPAKVIRVLGTADLEHIREAGGLYVGYARDFASGLVAV
ncbi:MAG TPA: gamma carbonic anhydrase family protein [Labilithrix sp.]|nr:gamma carbonic anhydrase family protein [Labilithrix sp.]